jgi:hypothetical protein
MRPQRFSIRYLLAALTLVCVSFGAVRFPTGWCLSITFSMAVAALSLMAVTAIVGRGRTRAFAVGFALVGAVHLVLALTTWFDEGSGKLLLSRLILDALAHPLGHAMPSNNFVEDKGLIAAMANYTPDSPPDRYYKFIVIGQSLMTLLVALAGGAIGQWVYGAATTRAIGQSDE